MRLLYFLLDSVEGGGGADAVSSAKVEDVGTRLEHGHELQTVGLPVEMLKGQCFLL